MTGNLRCVNNDKGFTLTEMLIAVAVLSLMGLVVIQVFITASSLNHKAADTDKAVAVCTAVVEQLKGMPAGTDLDVALLGTVFPEASVKIGADGQKGTMDLKYTGDWEPIASGASKTAGFIFHAEFTTASPEEGGVTLLQATVTKQNRYFHKADPQPVLFDLEAALPQHLKGGVQQ